MIVNFSQGLFTWKTRHDIDPAPTHPAVENSLPAPLEPASPVAARWSISGPLAGQSRTNPISGRRHFKTKHLKRRRHENKSRVQI